MKNIKLMKQHSKKIVKSHYIILVMACLMSAIIGNEFFHLLILMKQLMLFHKLKEYQYV